MFFTPNEIFHALRDLKLHFSDFLLQFLTCHSFSMMVTLTFRGLFKAMKHQVLKNLASVLEFKWGCLSVWTLSVKNCWTPKTRFSEGFWYVVHIFLFEKFFRSSHSLLFLFENLWTYCVKLNLQRPRFPSRQYWKMKIFRGHHGRGASTTEIQNEMITKTSPVGYVICLNCKRHLSKVKSV